MTTHVSTPAAFNMPQALGVDLNGSNYGPPIPIVYGTNKTAGNCIWYGDFTATQVSGGGKGGGGQQGVSYNYTASYMFAICEGPISGFGNVWQDSSFQTLSELDPAFTALGTSNQAPWSHFGGTQALSYGYTALVAWLKQNLGGSANTPNYQFEVQGFHIYGSASNGDANPSDVLNDICTDPTHGMGFDYLGSLTQYSNYCIANSLWLSPVYDEEQNASQAITDLMSWTNSAVYFSEGKLKIVPYGDVAVTGNGVTYTPDLTVQHAFTDSDYIYDPGNPPVEVERKAAADALNTVRVAYSDRSYYYYQMLAEAKDENDSLQNGIRSVQSVNIPACTQAAVARFIAQNLLQREFYIRNHYKWKTAGRWAFLEPTDVVSLQDSTLGLNGALVRITSVEEDEDGTLNFEAEELPIGVGHSTAYAPPTNSGYTLDVLSDPGPVDEPLFFRYPAFVPGQTGPTIGIAVSAGSAMWGSAQLWLSYDGTDYFYSTTITNQARYGEMATALPVGSDPDTVNTPQVTLEQGQLLGGTQADADNLVTLAMVDTEVISYETATLQSGETYELSYLRRGCYNNPIAAHSAGAPFVRLDSNIVQVPFDPSQVGNTIYAKFLSFNVFGKTPRTLAEETAYSYVIGASPSLPDVPGVPGSFAVTPGPDGASLTWTNTNPAAVKVTSIERSAASTGPFTVIAQVGNAHTNYIDLWTPDQLSAGNPLYYRARALGALPQAGFSAYTAIVSSAGNNTTQTATNANNNANTANNGVAAINSSANPNLIPDSGFKSPSVYWSTVSGTTSITQNLDGVHNCIEYTGTGAPSGYNYRASKPIPITPGTYTLSAVGWCNNVTAGNIFLGVYDPSLTTNYGSLAITANGQRQSEQITIPSGATQCVVLFDTGNATVVSDQGCGIQEPMLQVGNAMTAYQENTGDQLSGGIGIDLSLAVHVNKTASNITYTGGATVQSLQPAEAGADVTGSHQSASTATLSNFTQSNLADDATYVRSVQQSSASIAVTVPNAQFQLGTSGSVLPGWNPVVNGPGNWYFQATAPSPQYGARYLVLESTTANEGAEMDCLTQFAVRPGDVVTIGGAVYSANGTQVEVFANFFTSAGAYISNIVYGTTDESWQMGSSSGIAPAGAAFARLGFYNAPSPTVPVYGLCNDIWATVNDPRVPNSAKAYVNMQDSTAGGNNWQNSTAPNANGITFSYTSTLTSITISWTSGTILFADGSSVSVTAGNTEFGGLSDTNQYFFYPYYSVANDALEFAGGANVGHSATAAQTQTLAANIPLMLGGWGIDPTSSGGGSQPIGGCLHESLDVMTREGTKAAKDLKLGDYLLTPKGDWTPITALASERCTEWLDIVTEAGNARVTRTQPYMMCDGTWKRAYRLRVGDPLANGLTVRFIEPIMDDARKIILTIAAPHAFILRENGEVLHNGTQKP